MKHLNLKNSLNSLRQNGRPLKRRCFQPPAKRKKPLTSDGTKEPSEDDTEESVEEEDSPTSQAPTEEPAEITEDETNTQPTTIEVGKQDGEEEEEEFEVYRKHGFRGQWEDPRQVASEAQSLYAGEYSRVINTKKSFRLLKVDKKRSYYGDIYLYGAGRILL